MSPVSRGRKPKKSKRRAGRGSKPASTSTPRAGADLLVAPARQKPAWFERSISAVLDRAPALAECQGPLELDQATAELLGEEMHRVLHEGGRELWFGWWLDELVQAAARRPQDAGDELGRMWQARRRLLTGLASIRPRNDQRPSTEAALAQLDKWRPADAAADPAWFQLLPEIVATGDVWEMRDVYGCRFGFIAGFAYPQGVDPHVFLFDIDLSAFAVLAGAGTFDSVEAAADGWRARVSDAAGQAQPQPIESTEHLAYIRDCRLAANMFIGDESRNVMDNWLRADRRFADLVEVLEKHGTLLPQPEPRDDVDPGPMAEEFTVWYVDRHGTQPDPEAVEALVAEWTETTHPDTWYRISPRRAGFVRALIRDWVAEHPVTVGANALLPELVRWLGEQSGLPEEFIHRCVAAPLPER